MGILRSQKRQVAPPTGAKVKKNAVSSEEVSGSPVKAKKSPEAGVAKDKGRKKPSPPARSTRPTTDSKLEAMDIKWSERFSRLEAMLLSKSLSQTEPSFQQVKVTPVTAPPAGISHSTEPFFELAPPTNRPKSLPLTSDRPLSSHRPSATDQTPTDPACQQKVGTSGSDPSQLLSELDMDTDSLSEVGSVVNVSSHPEEGELSDLEQDLSVNDTDQAVSEEHTYRETMREIRSYMGWSHIPDIDSTSLNAEDNPFSFPKQQPAGKISVNLPTDDWLCRKMSKLNVTLVQGYPSKSSESGGLQHDHFVKPAKSQVKWYGLHPSQDKPAGSVAFWHCDVAKLNSSYSRIARSSGLTSPAPASRTISQDTLRRWEKSAGEATYVCNQAAGLSRCINKVQKDMTDQLKIIQAEQSKGKSVNKVSTATEELQYLMKFIVIHYETTLSQLLWIRLACVTW